MRRLYRGFKPGDLVEVTGLKGYGIMLYAEIVFLAKRGNSLRCHVMMPYGYRKLDNYRVEVIRGVEDAMG